MGTALKVPPVSTFGLIDERELLVGAEEVLLSLMNYHLEL